MSALRGFRRPRAWLAIWLVLVAIVAITSLVPSQRLPQAPFANVDKLEHFLAYAVLCGYAVMLFAHRRAQSLAALGLIALGIGLELAQGLLTATRTPSSADALANTLGVLAGLLLAPTPLARVLERIDARGRR